MSDCHCAISGPGLCVYVNQGSHLNLSQTSAQRHRTYFLLNNKAVNEWAEEEGRTQARSPEALLSIT